MVEIQQTDTFHHWISRLRDRSAAGVIARRIDRLRDGLLGDVKPVGGGVSELRIDHGPGYRVYFVKRGKAIIVLLCGGDKSSQARDIRTARTLADNL